MHPSSSYHPQDIFDDFLGGWNKDVFEQFSELLNLRQLMHWRQPTHPVLLVETKRQVGLITPSIRLKTNVTIRPQLMKKCG